jgi:alkylated DNA repair dioxygenase AlkB
MVSIVNNYVDEAFEKEVLKLVPKIPRSKYKGRNQILRWGNKKPYHQYHRGNVIPEVFHRFQKDFPFTSAQINEYYPGQSLEYHIDDINAGDSVRIINLYSECDILFRKGSEHLTYTMPRYSLTTFSEEHRFEWEHAVRATQLRYSVVFRNYPL